MPYRRAPATQARLDALRDRIVDAATDLLAGHGYAGCSMLAVAGAAGVATGSVYRHFPSKADLVTEVFRRVVGREVAAVAAAARRTGGVRVRVTAIVETFAGRALRSPRLAYALLAEPVDASVDAARLAFRQAFRDVIAEVISDGVARGVLPDQDARLTAAALVGAVGEALVGPLSAAGSAPPASASAGADPIPSLVTFALRAIGGCDVLDA